MGTCFPHAIVGENGYLVTHQNSIRKLSLITEIGCISGGPPLKEFTNLQELSWKGLLSDDDCASLKAFLDLHHKRLTSLELDFIDWAEVEHYYNLPDDDEDKDDLTPLTDLILPAREDNYEVFLPNLQTFSLSAASFKGSWDRLIHGFNLHGVRELRLVNCKRTIELLDYTARTDVCLNAIRVELVLRQVEMFEVKIGFLAPLDSLEDLFLMFESDYAGEGYAQMILRHRDTLRRLVYHRRHYCMAEKAPYWEQFCDSSIDEKEGAGFAEVLRETKLESAGVCGEPSKLQRSFQNFASRVDSLQLLHLRFTGKAERKPKFFKESEAHGGNWEFARADLEARQNGTTPPQPPSEAEWQATWEQIQGENWRADEEKSLEAFANWAFGPDGFPRLQVLASGDFSHGNRFADSQTFWCRGSRGSRSKKTWRMVVSSDIAENELIDANRDMLSACPVSPLFYRYGRGDLFPGIS